ncbi:MAG TPA: ABC transporter permease [Draconibacterium sp.]|nr:ABC transporter permease [Draconibacterium sp.]
MLFIRLIFESLSFAFNSLKANKLRTSLSLLGITIGIFTIISVFTVIDSLEDYIKDSLSSLGSEMVYVMQMPWGLEEGETEYPMWKYIKRPLATPEETEEIMRRANTVENAAFLFTLSRTIQSGSDKLENAIVLPTSYGLFDVWNLELSKGRYFSEMEMKSGAPVALIGYEISQKLFKDMNPVGRSIKIQGHNFRIIGVYKKTGQDMFGTSMDRYVHISDVAAYSLADIRNRNYGQTICVKAKSGIDSDYLMAELENILRTIRRLKPLEENNFALNRASQLSSNFDQLFIIINFAGAIIGGFSILVGGFGIANIMFVSVKERTKIIGIQKSLGAKRYFILLQFIFEAIVLSVIGGVFGLILIFIGSLVVHYVADFNIILTAGNITKGLLISSVIGFLAGFLPARAAAKLDPVIAINSV